MTTYYYSADLESPDGIETDVRVSFTVNWGTPESGTHNCPPENYDPGSPDEMGTVKILSVAGEKPTKAQELWYALSIEACYEDMLQYAAEYGEVQ